MVAAEVAAGRLLADRVGEETIDPTLDRIQSLLRSLGDPQTAFPVVMIAGTNGKTTTSRVIEQLLLAAGLRTGLFTSPHLHAVTERIRIDGSAIEGERFIALHAEVAPIAELVDADGGRRLSMFEMLTALAYAAFADAPVDVAVMEIGMGGRWDAVNAADATVAVICPIGLDHMHVLGDTVEQIAGEKAGIIAPGCAVVSAAQQPGARAVISERAAAQQADVWWDGEQFDLRNRRPGVAGQLLDMRIGTRRYADVPVPLLGAHQAQNTVVGCAAVTRLIGDAQPISRETLLTGLAGLTSPGRMQVLARQPTILADAAHNPAGIVATLAAVTESFAPVPLVCVLAVMRDKDAAGMLTALGAADAFVIATEIPAGPPGTLGATRADRGLPAADLAAAALIALGPHRCQAEPDLAAALTAARTRLAGQPGGLILVTGSIALIAAAEAILGGAG
ncbi:MAG: dihydrofolate synthase [Actinomycetales bacterium]|nr:dihydrofolate synthase [Actinomycetales bacterium]